MDPVVFNKIRSFLCDGTLPPALTKVQQNNFGRKTKNYELQGELDRLGHALGHHRLRPTG